MLNKEQYRFHYGRKASQDRLKKLAIKLPATPVIVIHSDGTRAWYTHMQEPSPFRERFDAGEKIKIQEGEQVGKIGSTGSRSTGPHLHYQREFWNKEAKEWQDFKPSEEEIDFLLDYFLFFIK